MEKATTNIRINFSNMMEIMLMGKNKVKEL